MSVRWVLYHMAEKNVGAEAPTIGDLENDRIFSRERAREIGTKV